MPTQNRSANTMKKHGNEDDQEKKEKSLESKLEHMEICVINDILQDCSCENTQ